MKTTLNQILIVSLKIEEKPLKFADGKVVKSEPNPTLTPYIVFDDHQKAPTGFGVKVARTKTTYIVQKKVQGKVIKVKVGNLEDYNLTGERVREELANGKIVERIGARARAQELVQEILEHGKNPNTVAREKELEEITLGKCFDEYVKFLTKRAEPAKENTIKSFEKNRKKFADWEKLKVRELKPDMIIQRFDEIASKTRTTAEQVFRMASTCINHVIANELNAANSEGRDPLLTYNPFKTLTIKEKYRSREKLEKDYTLKGFRKPLSLRETLGPFLNALWHKRKENPTGGDYWLTCFILGTRKSEAAELLWRETLTDTEALQNSWVCLESRRVFFYETKNHSDLSLPMPVGLLELLRQRRDMVEDIHSLRGKWVFPARSNSPKRKVEHYTDGRVLLRYICEEAKINRIAPHDARRTFGNVADELTSESMVSLYRPWKAATW